MTHEFDPSTFLEVANNLKDDDSCEAEYRTAVGRAYYAVYGVTKLAYCLHNKLPLDDDSAFRHGTMKDIAEKMRKRREWKTLRDHRETSDYVYDTEVDMVLTREAIRLAIRMLTAIESVRVQPRVFDRIFAP